MSKSNDWTNMGEGDGRFPTTTWGSLNLKDLSRLYWKPVYCYLRRKTNYDNQTSKDITQDFFLNVVMGRNLIEKADKTKGKFRTYLLTALRNYVIDISRGEDPPNDPIGDDFPDDDNTHGSEEEFNRVWLAELLEKTLSQVQLECEQTNKKVHWKVFEAKVLIPIYEDTKPPSMTQLSKEYGIGTPAQASNMIVTVKRRLNKHFERNSRLMMALDDGSDAEIQAEISDLLKSLSKKPRRI